jgi:hypothetical protein
VIPGGAENAEELRNALAHDPIAAAHYAGFDLAKTHVVKLTSDEQMYVSYRLNNHIYWTRKRLKLLKGEKIITDGKNAARTRCGNRLSAVAEAPIAAKQPLDMTLDPSPLPDLAEARPTGLPMALPFPVGSSLFGTNSGGGILGSPDLPVGGGTHVTRGSTITPPITPPGAPPITPPGPPVPPIATPEPDSLMMTSAGISMLLASGWFACFRRKFHN